MFYNVSYRYAITLFRLFHQFDQLEGLIPRERGLTSHRLITGPRIRMP